jgi:Ca2+-binding EF-hand superfamily protein
MKLTDAEFDDFFAKCDLNRDGEIDFSEFAAVIMGSPKCV